MTEEKKTNPSTETKVVLYGRLAYVHAFKPYKGDTGSEEKYSVMIIIPKSDKAQLGKIKAAINLAYERGASEKWGGKAPAKDSLKTPVHSGDEKFPEDSNFKDCYIMNATSKNPPGVVDMQREPITGESDLYSGCYAYVAVNFFAFDAKGNRGIACGLNNIMKHKDGPFMGGRTSAADDFAGIETPAETGEVVDDDFFK